MNTKNNQRSKASSEKIVRAVFYFMEEEKKPLDRITVREVCERAGINRSTFYAHYMDVYDVVEKVEKRMANGLTLSFLDQLEQGASMETCFVSLFSFIQEYHRFYEVYLNESSSSGVISIAWDLLQDHLKKVSTKDFGARSEKELEYRGAFFLFGLTGLIKMWLAGNCKESPAEMVRILKDQFDSEKNLLMPW